MVPSPAAAPGPARTMAAWLARRPGQPVRQPVLDLGGRSRHLVDRDDHQAATACGGLLPPLRIPSNPTYQKELATATSEPALGRQLQSAGWRGTARRNCHKRPPSELTGRRRKKSVAHGVLLAVAVPRPEGDARCRFVRLSADGAAGTGPAQTQFAKPACNLPTMDVDPPAAARICSPSAREPAEFHPLMKTVLVWLKMTKTICT